MCVGKNHFRGPFPSKAGGWRVGPAGGRGAGGDKPGSVFSHGDSLTLGRDERMEAGTHGAEQRTGARSKEMSRNGI